jgi:hypothetical protein
VKTSTQEGNEEFDKSNHSFESHLLNHRYLANRLKALKHDAVYE